MSKADDIDLIKAFKNLLAENKSHEERLQDYAKTIDSRDKEIEMLQRMLSEANEHKSTLDGQVMELNDLRSSIHEIQQQAGYALYMAKGSQQQAGNSHSVERQFENLTLAYANLQAQFSDLQMQLLDMNNRNLLLQQQSSRIAELESLLTNVEAERDEIDKRNQPCN